MYYVELRSHVNTNKTSPDLAAVEPRLREPDEAQLKRAKPVVLKVVAADRSNGAAEVGEVVGLEVADIEHGERHVHRQAGPDPEVSAQGKGGSREGRRAAKARGGPLARGP